MNVPMFYYVLQFGFLNMPDFGKYNPITMCYDYLKRFAIDRLKNIYDQNKCVIEALTGENFFNSLDAETQKTLEDTDTWVNWNLIAHE